MPIKRRLSAAQIGFKHGFRSGLEEVISAQIEREGYAVRYETMKIGYTKPARESKYTPDWVLDNGIIVEGKGRFETGDRQKHLLIKKQQPHLDIRFVFSNSRQKIRKGSPTTYGDWCVKYGFTYADKLIPLAWFKEKTS